MRKYWSTFVLVSLFALALVVLPSRHTDAGVSCSVPFNLTNGTTADASQVMANYNAILTCLSANTAASGANNDITSLSGLTTPLSPAQGGSAYFIGGTSVGTNTVTLANPTPNGFSYTQGNLVTFLAGGTNATGSGVTLNVNSLGAKAVFKQTLAGPVALTGNEIQTGQLVAAYYDGTQFEIVAPITPIAIVNISQTAPPYGFDMPVNLQLNATVGSNLLTVAIKAADTGSDPSATDPVLVPFRSTTAGSGAVTWVALIGAYSINTNATGATLGCQNNVPCRFWVELFCNASPCLSSSSFSMALWQSGAGSASPSINPLNETVLASTTAMSGGATSAGVFYSPNGTTLGNEPFRILGFVETTEATAGTYATAPSKVQLFGPGVKKPGDVVQTVYATNTGTTSIASTAKTATGTTGAITPTSNANLISVRAYGNVDSSATSTNIPVFQLSRGSSPTLIGNISACDNTGASPVFCGVALEALDNPATASSQAYTVYGALTTGTGAATWLAAKTGFTPTGVIILNEIMGSLEPANDNFTPLSAVG